ncbi:hypothetical protein [Streptomyces inhibens]|nr:hypothetical protein [Streptomyces inhibens]
MNTAGEAVGESLVLMKDGMLDSLERAWWTDDTPIVLPPVEQIQLIRRK